MEGGTMNEDDAHLVDAERVAKFVIVRRGGAWVRRGQKSRSDRAAYTLLEICLTLAVVAVMIGATLPLTQGILSEERLRGLGNDLADFASTARKLAVREGRTYVVKFAETRIGLGPWAGDDAGFEETLALEVPRNATVEVRHEESEKWRKDLLWFFQPGGLSDPLQMRLQEGDSWSVRVFSPLTALAREEASHFQ